MAKLTPPPSKPLTVCGYCIQTAEVVKDTNGVLVCQPCAWAHKFAPCATCLRLAAGDHMHADANGALHCMVCCPGCRAVGRSTGSTAIPKNQEIVKTWTLADPLPNTFCDHCKTTTVVPGSKTCHNCRRRSYDCIKCHKSTTLAVTGIKGLNPDKRKLSLLCQACACEGDFDNPAVQCHYCGGVCPRTDVAKYMAARKQVLRGPYGADDPVIEETVNNACIGCVAADHQCQLCKRAAPLHASTLNNAQNAATTLDACAACWRAGYRFCGGACRCAYALADLSKPDHLDGKWYCIFCVKTMVRCPVCNVAVIDSRHRATCPDCVPINNNHEARYNGKFLGHPDEHEECVRHRAAWKSKQKAPEHVGACKFDGLYYGVELEVENRSGGREENALQVRKLMPPKSVLIKHDGSLETGFEIVTGPATLDWHRASWNEFFAWTAKEHKLLSHDAPKATCGLHVHVSSAPLTKLQIGKIVSFVHDPANRDFIRLMAGRPCNAYTDWFLPKQLGRRAATKYAPRQDRGTRYTAVNLQNPHTIEFRLFRGTLNKQTFFARLEFAAALVAFAAPGVASVQAMLKGVFLKWLCGRRKDYPSLYAFLADVGEVPTLGEPPTVSELNEKRAQRRQRSFSF